MELFKNLNYVFQNGDTGIIFLKTDDTFKLGKEYELKVFKGYGHFGVKSDGGVTSVGALNSEEFIILRDNEKLPKILAALYGVGE